MKHLSYLLLTLSFLSFTPAHTQDNVVLVEEDLGDLLTEQDSQTLEISFDNDDFLGESEELVLPPVLQKESDQPAAVQPVTAKKLETPVIAVSAPAARKEALKVTIPGVEISLQQVFAGSPVIYTILFLMSVAAVCIWLYIQTHLRFSQVLPRDLTSNLRNKLTSNQYDDALTLCQQQNSFFCKMIATGIASRKAGFQVMTDAMKSEGKRATINYWQKISFLNDIAIIAPMIGLLGTVLGMFYAFYDLNRSMESVSNLFDGLGVSVGTTVAGLIVAIISMMLHSLVKYRLAKTLTLVENEAHALASLIDSKASAIQDR